MYPDLDWDSEMTVDGIQIHGSIKTGIQPIYDSPIPDEAIKDGKATFSWTGGEAKRGAQVSAIWIIKN